MSLDLDHLTSTAFKPFGEVIESDSGGESVNQGRGFKRSNLTNLTNLRDNSNISTSPATANVATFRIVSKKLPWTLKLLEKHPYSSQMFIPFHSNSKYLVIVAQDLNNCPDFSTLKGFISDTSKGFNYKPGIWHSPMVAIGEEYIDFVSITYEIPNDPFNTIEYSVSDIIVKRPQR